MPKFIQQLPKVNKISRRKKIDAGDMLLTKNTAIRAKEIPANTAEPGPSPRFVKNAWPKSLQTPHNSQKHAGEEKRRYLGRRTERQTQSPI